MYTTRIATLVAKSIELDVRVLRDLYLANDTAYSETHSDIVRKINSHNNTQYVETENSDFQTIVTFSVSDVLHYVDLRPDDSFFNHNADYERFFSDLQNRVGTFQADTFQDVMYEHTNYYVEYERKAQVRERVARILQAEHVDENDYVQVTQFLSEYLIADSYADVDPVFKFLVYFDFIDAHNATHAISIMHNVFLAKNTDYTDVIA